MRREGKRAHSKGSAAKRRGERTHMPYSEMEQDVETKLNLISLRAQKESSYQFTCLAHLPNEGFLKGCYLSLGRNKASGIDGVSWVEYGQKLEGNLKSLVERLKAKRYRPQPVRRVYLPKDDKTMRPLGIPAQEDKVVQKGASRILEHIYEADFKDSSHGFRPNRGCHTALKAASEIMMHRPINHVLEADIKGFFDNVSHAYMMEFLGKRINDPSLLRIIGRFLIAGYKDSELLVRPENGTPQGGNLSPILANIFLHYVLDAWFEDEVKPQMRGECHLVRYADDFIVMVRYQDDAQKLMHVLRERFEQFGLQLHPDKTRVISFGRFEPENAQKQGRKANTFEFLGLVHYCARSRAGKYMPGHRTSANRLRKKLKEMNLWLKVERNRLKLSDIWKAVSAKLRGHFQYYGISGNYRGISRYSYRVIQMLFKWLNRRSQKKSFSWEQFAQYLKKYPLPKPHITFRLYELSVVR
jgi:RNA-directed DNA polymerase